MSDPSKYPAEVFYNADDEGYIALARDLPGCSAFGSTRSEAISELQDAIVAWQQAAEAAGNPIPEPSEVAMDLPSGKILLRLPRTLHAMLAGAARREGVSLNQHILSLLSASTTLNQVVLNCSHMLMTHQLFMRDPSNIGSHLAIKGAEGLTATVNSMTKSSDTSVGAIVGAYAFSFADEVLSTTRHQAAIIDINRPRLKQVSG